VNRYFNLSLDKEGIIKETNKELVHLLGLEEDIAGQQFLKILAKESFSDYQKLIEEAKQKGYSSQRVLKVIDIQGEKLSFMGELSSIITGEGRMGGFYISLMSVNTEKEDFSKNIALFELFKYLSSLIAKSSENIEEVLHLALLRILKFSEFIAASIIIPGKSNLQPLVVVNPFITSSFSTLSSSKASEEILKYISSIEEQIAHTKRTILVKSFPQEEISLIYVPLLSSTQVEGIMSLVVSGEVAKLSTTFSMEILQTIGWLLGALLVNYRISEHNKLHLRRIEVTKNLVKLISSSLSIRKVIREFPLEIRRLKYFDYLALSFLDEKNKEVVFYMFSPVNKRWKRKTTLPLLDSFITKAFLDAQPLLINEPQKVNQQLFPGGKSCLIFPLIINNNTFATLNFCSYKEDFYSQNDIEILQEVIDALAIALDRARLFRGWRKRAQELMKANRELKYFESMKVKLLTNISHELNSPLVSIRGYIELLLKETLGPLLEEQKSKLKIALNNVKRLHSLIEDFIEASRFDQNLPPEEVEIVDLQTPLQNAVINLKLIAEKKGVIIKTYYPAKAVRIRGSPLKLKLIFDNLLENAIKFNREGGVVAVRLNETPDGWALIQIADTGIGISLDDISKVFDDFYQADSSATREHQGAGLGLSIVKKLIRMHRGEIAVSSTPGAGTKFIITFPLWKKERVEYFKKLQNIISDKLFSEEE